MLRQNFVHQEIELLLLENALKTHKQKMLL